MTDDDPLAALRARFAERALADADALSEALETGPGDDIESRVHGLAGSAGVFGFADISRAAGEIDALFARGEAPPDAAIRSLIALIRTTYS